MQEYEKALRERAETFRSLSGPIERAEFDADLFVRHYFGPDGKPNRSITPDPLILKGFTGDWGVIARAAHSIRGLEIALATQGHRHTVCLGWDAAAVRYIAEDLEYSYKAEKDKQLWQEAIENHKELVKDTKKAMNNRESASKKKGNTQNDLLKCVGSYTIRCDAIGSRFGSNLPTIDIEDSGPTANILIAAVD